MPFTEAVGNDKLFEELTEIADRSECARCGKWPVVGHEKGVWKLRCECRPEDPIIIKRPHHVARRLGKMVDKAIAERPAEQPLTRQDIQQYISPKATDKEAHLFLLFCQAQGLNPFVGDAYLLKYEQGKPAAMVVGISALLKRGTRHPAFRGYDSGIIVEQDGEHIEVAGSLMPPGSTLVGGWCDVDRPDLAKPPSARVSFKEYNKAQANWRSMPGTMIEKVAIMQALRRGFPEETDTLFEGTGLEVIVGDPESEKVADAPAIEDAPPVSEGVPPVSEGVVPDSDGVVDGEHPWLTTCPLHDAEWFQQGNMTGPAHKDGENWCNLDVTISAEAKKVLMDTFKQLGWERLDVARWVREHYNGKWSELTTADHISATEGAKALLAKEDAGPKPEPNTEQLAADLFGTESRGVEPSA